MKTVLSYKTETTGLPNWKARSNDETQPHLVRLAAILFNAETQEVVDQMDVLIIPDGWEVPQETIDVHGITVERAHEEGIHEHDAIDMFLKLCGDSVRITSNKQFNQRIMRIALKRHANEEQQEKWAEKDNHFCAMKMAKDDLGNKGSALDEAVAHYTGNTAKLSDSLVNADSTARMYFAINNK